MEAGHLKKLYEKAFRQNNERRHENECSNLAMIRSQEEQFQQVTTKERQQIIDQFEAKHHETIWLAERTVAGLQATTSLQER